MHIQIPIMVCDCGGHSWYLICEPTGKDPEYIIAAFDCTHCRFSRQCDVRRREEI